MTSGREDRPVGRASTSRALLAGARGVRHQGWLFLLPALTAYGLFVLWPLVTSIRYSLYSWDGVAPAKWVGLANYGTVLSDPTFLSVLGHAFELMIYFSAIPIWTGGIGVQAPFDEVEELASVDQSLLVLVLDVRG